MVGDEERPEVDHSTVTRFHFHHPHPNMPTELPYAADAEDSLSYDELQVSLCLLEVFVGLR